MSWQASLTRALRDLKSEEARLSRELEKVRATIASLGGLKGAAGGAKKTGRKKRTLSPKARAAISRAARKRWAKYRAEKAAKA